MTQAEHCSWSDDDAAAFGALMLGGTRQFGVVFFDAGLCITGWNSGAHAITGWAAGEVLGHPTALLFTPEDRARKLDEHEASAAAIVGVAEDERWHIRKDGTRFWSSGLTLPLGSARSAFVKVFRDTTHLRGRAKTLENLLQEHEQAQQERERFLATIVHEMRNPLSPLKMSVQLLQRQGDETGRLAEPLRVIGRQVDCLEGLIEDLVDLTRVQKGKLSIEYGIVELQGFLREALDMCREAAGIRGVALHLVAPTVPIYLEADARRLQQVVVNLCNNAIKFTQRGGNAWLTATADQSHVVLTLRDDGRGITADLLPRIFEVFTQAGDASSGRGAGLGIGLALVKEIVSLHQGTVEVRSPGVGKGSEFVVRIPQHKPNVAAPLAGQQDSPASAGP
ncbi:PAS domain-containing sensor histidine kinase [Pseudoduganella chitinolytica]|uniref:histidine kinase n=1 Tax=Pseudoduganella chitinolytica TaxID=34070 RepID=A0ABY8BEM4_9BURK|nr:PAS domain-containing sensor histidine kinase [Pseudoduganella chitinolytica]WEF34352.1 PAS domain-containing sensor histidine kinase [Pseudoduganella chitinolytica]